MIRSALATLILSVLGATAGATPHDQLGPLPEAGLWRHMISILIDGKEAPPNVRDVPQQLPGELSGEQPATLTAAMAAAASGVNMECLPSHQVAGILSLDSLQQRIQRDIPDCELSLLQTGRSRVQVSGLCNSQTGFYGEMRGELEIISSYEIHSSFTGRRLTSANPSPPSQGAGEHLADFVLSVTSRWAATDCGSIVPRERLSF